MIFYDVSWLPPFCGQEIAVQNDGSHFTTWFGMCFAPTLWEKPDGVAKKVYEVWAWQMVVYLANLETLDVGIWMRNEEKYEDLVMFFICSPSMFSNALGRFFCPIHWGRWTATTVEEWDAAVFALQQPKASKTYPLVMTNSLLLKMANEIVSFPIKNGGSFHSYVNVYQRVLVRFTQGIFGNDPTKSLVMSSSQQPPATHPFPTFSTSKKNGLQPSQTAISWRHVTWLQSTCVGLYWVTILDRGVSTKKHMFGYCWAVTTNALGYNFWSIPLSAHSGDVHFVVWICLASI